MQRPGRSPRLTAVLATAALLGCQMGVVQAALRYDAATDAEGGPLMTPVIGELMNRQYVFEIPHNPVGVLFLAHGCVHDAADWWPPSDACPQCSGLPEEVSHTKQALARGYAVIAIDSKDRSPMGRCFSYPVDKWGVKYILENWTRQMGLDALPLFALGVSAGAAFALRLPKITRVNGVISEVLGVEDFGPVDDLLDTYPPTVFIDMQRDAKMTQRIALSMNRLAAAGVPNANIPVDPRPVGPLFFSDRSQYITPDLSRRIVLGLHKIGMLDYQGYVTTDPRYTKQPWEQQLMRILPGMRPETGDTTGLASDPAMISEQMNLAWAQHEIISDYLTACLAWLEAGGQQPIDGFLRELQIKGRLVDVQPTRQARPALQDDEALKQAAKQVEQELAVTYGSKDSWGDMYAAYVEWLKTNPTGNITFTIWRATKAAGRFRYTDAEINTDPGAAAAMAQIAAEEADLLQRQANQGKALVRMGIAGPGGKALAVAAQFKADQAKAKAQALAAVAARLAAAAAAAG